MLNMKLPNPRHIVVATFTLAALTGCFKQAAAPEAPVRRGASDQCGKTPQPSGGAYLAGIKGTWQEVKTLLEKDCTSCHPTYVDHEIAKLLADKFVKTTDDGTMPKNGERLSLEDRTVYILWANAGAPKDGEEGGTATATGSDTATGTGTEPATPTDETPPVDEPEPAEDEGDDETTDDATGCT